MQIIADINVSICNSAIHCFDNDYVGKQPVAWKEYCAEYWLKNSRKAWTGADHSHITEIAINTMQSINHLQQICKVSGLNLGPCSWKSNLRPYDYQVEAPLQKYGHQYFLFFLQCFQTLFFWRLVW